jgi:hypothetical protein
LGNALLENGKEAAKIELTRADTLQPDMPETLIFFSSMSATTEEVAEKVWFFLTLAMTGAKAHLLF